MQFKNKIILFYFILLLFLSLSNAIDVKTSSGLVRGQTLRVLDQNINEFLGIPYAEPPIGSLRFAKPNPIVKPIPGIIDATKVKDSCIQPDILQTFMGNITKSEDCLFLNIWSPVVKYTGDLKPVMFWIYGGALSVGSIFQHEMLYNGTALANQDIVFVSVNYRLGPLGFLFGGEESAPGNVGFFDQLLGLKWVRENIHMFGGNKDMITIFGMSAGSWSVSAHIISPLTNGLFRRAIMQSGAILFNKERDPISKTEALNNAKQMAKHLNCTDSTNWLDCLRKVDAKEFIQLTPSTTYPILETEYLPISARNAFMNRTTFKDIDLLAGVVKNEGSVFNPKIFSKNVTENDFIDSVKLLNQMFHNINVENVTEFYLKNIDKNNSEAIKWAISDIAGDLALKCPTYKFAVMYQLAFKGTVFFYELTNQTKNAKSILGCDEKTMGICHGSDLDLVFGLPLLKPEIYSNSEIEFSKEVIKLWTMFAKYGREENWPIITNWLHGGAHVKNLNPNNLTDIFEEPFKTTCDGIWKDYY